MLLHSQIASLNIARLFWWVQGLLGGVLPPNRPCPLRRRKLLRFFSRSARSISSRSVVCRGLTSTAALELLASGVSADGMTSSTTISSSDAALGVSAALSGFTRYANGLHTRQCRTPTCAMPLVISLTSSLATTRRPSSFLACVMPCLKSLSSNGLPRGKTAASKSLLLLMVMKCATT